MSAGRRAAWVVINMDMCAEGMLFSTRRNILSQYMKLDLENTKTLKHYEEAFECIQNNIKLNGDHTLADCLDMVRRAKLPMVPEGMTDPYWAAITLLSIYGVHE